MPSISSSVLRTFKLFEMFEKHRKPMTAIELANGIGAPRSSCAALLKALADLGMLGMDRRTNSYFPTARFAELGSWIADGSLFPASVLELLETLRDVTGETVTLVSYQDLMIELVQVEKSDQAISFTAEVGQRFSVWGTGVGTAYLSTLNTLQIRALYRRAENRKLVDPTIQPIETVLAHASQCRDRGYYIAVGAVFPDATAISAPVSSSISARPLVISITGPSERMRPNFEKFGNMLVSELNAL